MTADSSAKKRMIACPRCKKETLYSPKNQWRPFCSERCKLIDIAAWASEEYRLDGGPATEEDSLPTREEEQEGH